MLFRSDEAQTAYFSNTGEDDGYLDGSGGATSGANPDIGAPGMENAVLIQTSTGPANVTMSGTSMATPDVAAAAAVLVSEDSTLRGDHEAVRERLLETAEPAPHIGETEIGHCQLNVENALADHRPEDDQADVLTEQARQRDNANRGLSGSLGGFLREMGVAL